jgi:predicted transglutaminase-like cysteine proteinase
MAVVSCTKAPQVARKIPPKPVIVKKIPRAPELSKLDQWGKLVRENRNAPVDRKLASVNTFFNQFDFIEDQFLWGQNDYWATLSETLTKSGGDCEDFTIAKYFTLKDLNIPDENMRITYVISIRTRKPHMVLTFNRNPRHEPIVLDTINNHLLPVSKRSDLVPVYSFNTNGYWLAREQDSWRGKRLGNASKLSLWREVLERMEGNKTGLPDS